ncbi:MAG: ATP-binding cassette domain-containing protein [Acidimicrobiales bacterium]
MASANSTSPPEGRFVRSARVLGTLNVCVSLGLSMLLAKALTDLAHGALGAGLILLLVVLVIRWLLTVTLFEWNAYSAREIRERWRVRTVDHLRIPRLEGERSRGDLLLAIDHAADGPSLEVLSTSARLSVLGLIIVFWSVGWLSTLITVALMALAVPLYQRAGRRSEALAHEYQVRRATLESRQLELLSHAPELRSLGAAHYGADEIAAISASENTLAMRAIRVALESSLVTEFLSGVSIGLVAMVVGFSLLGGRVTLLRALTSVLVTGEIFTNIRRFGAEFHRRENAATSLALLSEGQPSPRPLSSGPLMKASGITTRVSDEVQTLTLHSGDRVLITGASGSGKSTLLQTLVGWREPRAGTVERSKAAIGYVSVESPLLSGSLWTNITLGEDFAREPVIALLDDLGLEGDRFANLDVPLLADGRGLSTGETVRVVLARSLIRHPDVLILDDIAGVMDESTQQLVRRRLEREHDIAIIEATVDAPLLMSPSQTLVLRHGG